MFAGSGDKAQSQLSPHIFVDLKQNLIVFKVGVPPAVRVGVQRLKETTEEPEDLKTAEHTQRN